MSAAAGVTTAVAEGVADAPRQLLVGGRWVDAAAGATFAVEDPATGEALCTVADAAADDGLAALDAAAGAFPAFAASAPRERSDMLRRAHDAVVEQADALALLMTLEMGKPLAESRAEVLYSAAFLRWYAEEAVRINGRVQVDEAGAGRIVTTSRPVGPCLLITPWNFPLAMGARKIAPALAAGCTAVVKPAVQTPLSMLALARILERAGLPDGVLNVVTTSDGPGVVAALLSDPRLRKLSFTGSTAVGRQLIAQSAEQVLRVSMELGGNAPFIVLDDADLDAAVEGALTAKMRNGGEACTAANRMLVHEAVAEEFAARLAARMGALRVGPGREAGVQLGPLIDARQRAAVAALVDDAVTRGARALCGGRALPGPGHFYAPTVLVDVPADAHILREEIFGPVAPVIPFATESEAVERANDTEYGLAAYVYTRDVDRAFAVADALEVGMVGLNQGLVSNAAAPFGGIKHSGFGREGGPEGIREYLDTKYLAMPVSAGR